MGRSAFFAEVEKEFSSYSYDELIERILGGFGEISENAGDDLSNDDLYLMLVMSAVLGIASKDGSLNDIEKKAVDETLGKAWDSGDMKSLYEIASLPVTQETYNYARMISNLGNVIAIPFLFCAVGFAYLDKKPNEDVFNELDKIFANNLISMGLGM